jgi:spermidine synthase
MMVLTPNMLTLNYMIDDKTNEMRVLPLTKIYAYQRSRFCQFLIAESRDKGKFLAIDGRIQTTEKEYMDYHEKLLYHIPGLDKRIDTPEKNALVLGAGEGITGSMLCSMGYNVDAVDVDGVLIKAIQEHLSDWTRQFKPKGKMTTYIYDAVDFMEHIKESEDKKYDVVVFDLTEPGIASEDCYGHETMKTIFSVMKDGAVFAYQNGSLYDKDPVMDKVIEESKEKYIFQVEDELGSESKIAEWKFKTLILKEIKDD